MGSINVNCDQPEASLGTRETKMNTVWSCPWKAYGLVNPKAEKKKHKRYTNRKRQYTVVKVMVKLHTGANRGAPGPTGEEEVALKTE